MSDFRPRHGQKEVLDYACGKLGISAVPGSGKTITLAELAARLVSESTDSDQEVLIVTLVNSAVDNFKQRINALVAERGLLANFGYRVRTLHGLAHDIVRERPGLVGLSDDFGIIDEREADAIRQDAVDTWVRAHPNSAEPYLSLEFDDGKIEWIQRAQWPRLVRDVAAAYIKRAKDLQLTPEVLLERLSSHTDSAGLHLARMGAEIYGDYQRSLAYRGAIDFDDLIRLALHALQLDPDFLTRLQQRWPYILEDEAQDSSELQEQILRLLVGPEGNWVRVGDPNQAIYDTFTNANPRYLRKFLDEDGVRQITLPESGRCQPAIIDLANYLVDWANGEHPNPSVDGPFLPQHIVPTGPGDPQPNPPADPKAVRFVDRDFSPAAELQAVADSLQNWLPDHGDQSVAVLVPRNARGFDLIELLRKRHIPYVELLRSSSVTRQTAGALGNVLRCLADPTMPRKLGTAFTVWRRDERDEPEAWARIQSMAKLIERCPAVEAYLWPRAGRDWLTAVVSEANSEEMELLVAFRSVACRWHLAANLPIDQLLLTLAGDLFREPAELALAHKLAGLLRDVASAHPAYRLPELVEELAVIARNERRFLGFASEDSGFKPPEGKVTVATMHKAKGLEWDHVHLLSVNNYNFPSGSAHDSYIAERWFVRDSLNLEAEALAQLSYLQAFDHSSNPPGESPSQSSVPVAGEATEEARTGYISERLRLLYVGITRARRSLVVTWNTGRRQQDKLQPAVPYTYLRDQARRQAREPGSMPSRKP